MCMLMLVFEEHLIVSFFFSLPKRRHRITCVQECVHFQLNSYLHRSFPASVMQHDAVSGFTEIELHVTALTPHDEEHLLYESGAVILPDDSVCVLRREGAIFIRCNSVGSPAVWRGNVSLPLAQDIRHLVTATQGSSSLPGGGGSGLSLCLPLNSWPRG